MKRQYLPIAILSALFCLANPLHAQQAKPPGPGPIGMVEQIRKVVEQLDLDEAHRTKVTAILEQATKDANDMVDKQVDLSLPDQVQQTRTFIDKVKAQVLAELPADQKQKFNADVRDSSRIVIRGRLQVIRESLDELDLTEDQRNKAMEAVNQAAENMRQLQNDPNAGNRAERVGTVLQSLREQLRGGAAHPGACRSDERDAPFELSRHPDRPYGLDGVRVKRC